MIDRALDIARLALALGRVERATLHEDGLRRETDTDHTVALALLVGDLADGPLRGRVDLGRAVAFAVVHDLVEALCGDTVSICLTDEERADKDAREAAAVDELAARLGPDSWVVRTIREYEARDCVEARLVHFADKVAPKLTHALNRGRSLQLLGIDPDFASELHVEQLARLAAASPDLPELADLFREAHEEAISEYRSAPAAPPPVSVIALVSSLTFEEAHKMCHATGNYIDRKCRKKWTDPGRNFYDVGNQSDPLWRSLVDRGLAASSHRYYHVTNLGLLVLRVWYRTQVAELEARGERYCGVLTAHLEARTIASQKGAR